MSHIYEGHHMHEPNGLDDDSTQISKAAKSGVERIPSKSRLQDSVPSKMVVVV